MIAVARGQPTHKVARRPVDFVGPYSVKALLDRLRLKTRRRETKVPDLVGSPEELANNHLKTQPFLCAIWREVQGAGHVSYRAAASARWHHHIPGH
jgi:hypothetical protein